MEQSCPHTVRTDEASKGGFAQLPGSVTEAAGNTVHTRSSLLDSELYYTINLYLYSEIMPTFRRNLYKQYILRQSSPKWVAQDFPIKVQEEK